MRYATRVGAAVALAFLLIASPLVAQTNGRIQGTVTDNSGAPVPGVSVTASSPSLQRAQSTTTDAKGEFRFASVPPGTYTVKADLSGFKSVNQTGVVVGLDRTVTLALKMEVAGVAETVTVTGESPIIDTTSTTTGVNATAELFNRIPMARDIYAISRVAAGTQNDGIGMVVYGSTGAENNYIIDGLNTTGVELGTEAKQLNFDFVEEVEVKTGGLPAEYGRMTGGVVNVLTKSGGNTFKGDLFGFYEGGGLQSDDSTAADRPATHGAVPPVPQAKPRGGGLDARLLPPPDARPDRGRAPQRHDPMGREGAARPRPDGGPAAVRVRHPGLRRGGRPSPGPTPAGPDAVSHRGLRAGDDGHGPGHGRRGDRG